MAIKELVKDYLQGLQAGGVLRLPVDDAARKVLREWMLAARGGGRPAQAQQQERPAQAEAQAEAPAGVEESMAMLRAAAEGAADGAAAEAEEMPVYFRPAGNTHDEVWAAAPRHLTRWAPLQELQTLRRTPVWGEGTRAADIMFVGDAPNYYDEQTGRPFCGEAGAKLDAMLSAMGLARREVYITHLVKYRPALPRQTFNNRPPSSEEVRVSLPVVEFEVKMVQPRVIVALGVIAARALLQQRELPLAACQQVRDARFCGVPVVVTHHPSYLLRTTSLAERRRLWEEMLRVMEIAGLPISEKQRGFFLPKNRA